MGKVIVILWMLFALYMLVMVAMIADLWSGVRKARKVGHCRV